MKKAWMLSLALVLLVAVGCSSSSSSGETKTHLSEQENGICPTAPTIVTGTAVAGATCGSASDCLPTCCSCTTGTGQWGAAECVNGKCDNTTACTDTAQLSFCK
jgi:hypothetical protein